MSLIRREKPDTALLCSLYFHKKDKARKANTLKWYDNITKTAGRAFNLYLYDDCSDISLKWLKRGLQPTGYCKNIYFFDSGVREGKAKKLNKLLREIKTKYVCVIDNDLLLPQNWLEECVTVCEAPRVKVCGVLVEDSLKLKKLETVAGVRFSIVNYLGGACMVWNRLGLGDQGFFCEKFGPYGEEDNEFLVRIANLFGFVCALEKRGAHLTKAQDCKEYMAWKAEQQHMAQKHSHPLIHKLRMMHRHLLDKGKSAYPPLFPKRR